jgi:predicted CoA-binding protein
MADDACPLPGDRGDQDEEAMISRMLAARRIVVVGLSDDPRRPSYGVAAALLRMGKEIVPVNPNCDSALGLKCFATLGDVPGEVEVVNVFRRPEHCAEVARAAAAVGAKGLWLQSGIESAEAESIARKAGMDFVQDRCIKVELMYRR